MPKVHLRLLLEVLREKLNHPPRGYQSQLPVAITQPFMSNAHLKTYAIKNDLVLKLVGKLILHSAN